MGLDIYFRTHKYNFDGEVNSETIEALSNDAANAAKTELKKVIDEQLVGLEEADEKMKTNDYWVDVYNYRYFRFVETIRPLIADKYEWNIYPFTKSVLPIAELKKLIDNSLRSYYKPEDAYFRKVNFIFKFFENKMYDEYFSLVDLDDVDGLIERCEKVLADNSLAQELLPTQSGFFFGGTEYDDYYFYDVEDCLKQMKEYRNKLEVPGIIGWVIFS